MGLFSLVIKLHVSPGRSDRVFNSGVGISILVCHKSFSFVNTVTKASVKACIFPSVDLYHGYWQSSSLGALGTVCSSNISQQRTL